MEDANDISVIEYIYQLNVSKLIKDNKHKNKELVTEAHKKGISVQVYTVNSITIMKKLIKLKVDGVFTNYPKIINTIVNENL